MYDSTAGAGKPLSLAAHEFAAEVEEMAANGVRRAQEESRRAGVPCVYSINGVLHWELPDGSLSTEDPWRGKNTPPAE
ncbi:hypothetical protein Pla108_10180 [Botrimarina colliarenosi]|uniref:Uncharacterized protein n=1 Tax=Botrimarina colliarenosi TaxID=2528001 RepID=A0A5C6APH2_9BACT|nr:hypothetical protein [Botrimarina colliarenosi]TWU00074.1 hypothetical protein Pla108_10180 [Botrimarina colliarenosi]